MHTTVHIRTARRESRSLKGQDLIGSELLLVESLLLLLQSLNLILEGDLPMKIERFGHIPTNV